MRQRGGLVSPLGRRKVADDPEINAVPEQVAVGLRLEAAVQRPVAAVRHQLPVARGRAPAQLRVRLQVHLDGFERAVHDRLAGPGQSPGDRRVRRDIPAEEVPAPELPRDSTQ